MHISYNHEVDSFLDGTRGMLLERIMGETGLGLGRRPGHTLPLTQRRSACPKRSSPSDRP